MANQAVAWPLISAKTNSLSEMQTWFLAAEMALRYVFLLGRLGCMGLPCTPFLVNMWSVCSGVRVFFNRYETLKTAFVWIRETKLQSLPLDRPFFPKRRSHRGSPIHEIVFSAGSTNAVSLEFSVQCKRGRSLSLKYGDPCTVRVPHHLTHPNHAVGHP